MFACHFPYRTILLFFIIPCPAWLLAVGIVVLDFLGFLGMGQRGDRLLRPPARWRRSRLRTTAPLAGDRLARLADGLGIRRSGRRRAPTPRLYVETDEPGEAVGARTGGSAAATAEGRARSVDEQLEAKLDHVLEKVSRYGRESLTPEEREILLRASEIYKRRRGQ